MNSRLMLICFFTIAVGIGCVERSNQENYANLEDEVATLKYLKEVEWPKAYAEQDTLLLDRILGDDFQMIDNSGKWFNKENEMDWIRNNASSYDSFNYEIKRLEILENGTAVVCGTGHIYKDSTESIYQSSNVLLKRNGEWKAILSHVSGFEKLED